MKLDNIRQCFTFMSDQGMKIAGYSPQGVKAPVFIAFVLVVQSSSKPLDE